MSPRGIFNKTHLSLKKKKRQRMSCRPGRIHGDLLRLLYLLADNKTKRHFRDLDEAIDVDSEAYCWRRSGFFWRMRASLGLACAQATTLASQVFGKGNPRSRAGRPSI